MEKTSLSRILDQNRIFLVPFVLLIVLGFLMAMLQSKGELVLWFNAHLSTSGIQVFYAITHLAEAGVLILITVLLMIWRLQFGLFFLLNFFLSGIIVQLLKKMVFTDYMRPVHFFRELNPPLQLIDSIEYHQHFSFPSGHSASAFAMFFTLSLFVKQSWLKFSCFLLACLIAISRVAIFQHFLEDILAGAFIGVLLSLFFYYWISRQPFFQKAFFSKGIFELLKSHDK